MPSLIEHVSASSIGPPMMKNMSLTPCALRHLARISLPVSCAISVSPPLISQCVRDPHPPSAFALGPPTPAVRERGFYTGPTQIAPLPHCGRGCLAQRGG